MTPLTNDLIFDLYREHRGAIISFLARRVRCPETALDLSQETYLRLLRKEGLPHAGNLTAYLFRTAERLAIDYLRQYRPTQPVEDLADDLRCHRPFPEELLLLREQCKILLDAVASLPKPCRHVLLLRKVDELSFAEIARRVGISEKTVQRHLVKAMLHCHKRMANPLPAKP